MLDRRETPDRELERRQQRELVLKTMRETLAPHEQEALCLRIFDNVPVETITEVLGLATVSGARRKLRAALISRNLALEEVLGD